MNANSPESEQTLAATPEQDHSTAGRSVIAQFPDGYIKFQEVGRGGMGIVYHSLDVELSRDIAIKLLHDTFPADSLEARRFLDEARITAQLQHPGIPAVHKVGTMANGRPFLAMKLIRGHTLDRLLKKPNARVTEFLPVMETIANAIGYAHSRNVIHRDLKPANIMVGAFGEVQVMDWGLAKVLTQDDQPAARTNPSQESEADVRSPRDSSHGTETRYGAYMGTPAFMPPEQAIGAIDQIDQRSDVFGLGGILCAILTGRPPFSAGDAESTRQLSARGQLQEAFTRFDSCSAEPSLIALAKRCLSVNPNDRPANGTEVAKEVARIRAESDERAKQAEIARLAGQARRRVMTGAAVAIGIALTLGLAASLWQARQAIIARTAAEAEETRTREAKAEVEATLKIVGTRTKLAMDAFNQMVFSAQNKLMNRAGTQDLRRELLENARDGLKTILDDARKQGSPDSTLIWCHIRMGDVEQNLGNIPAAQIEYRTGKALAQQLVTVEPGNQIAKRELAICSDKIGGLCLQLRQPKEALECYQQSHKLFRDLVDSNPNDQQFRRDLSTCLTNLGNANREQGNAKLALDFYRKSLAIDEQLADSSNPQTQRDLSIGFNNLGRELLGQAQFRDAREVFDKALAIRQKLLALDPENRQAQRDLSISFDWLGNTSMDEGQTKEALDYYQRAFQIRQKLAAADPKNAQSQQNLIVSYFKFGSVAEKTDDYLAAIGWYEKALQVISGFDRPEFFEKDLTRIQELITKCRSKLDSGKQRERAPQPRTVH